MSQLQQSFIEQLISIEQFFSSYHSKEQQLQQALHAVSMPHVKAAIEEELKSLEQEAAMLESQKYEVFVQVAHHVFTHPQKHHELIIKMHRDSSSSRNSRGGYDDVMYYTFAGKLGELLWRASDFADTGEVYFGYQSAVISHEDIQARELSSAMSFDEFKGKFLEYFCETPDVFEDYFKKCEQSQYLCLE